MRRRRAPLRVEELEARSLLSASNLQAVFRSGQTFLTWTEDQSVAGEQYHVVPLQPADHRGEPGPGDAGDQPLGPARRRHLGVHQ